jgi:hypothetical protein
LNVLRPVVATYAGASVNALALVPPSPDVPPEVPPEVPPDVAPDDPLELSSPPSAAGPAAVVRSVSAEPPQAAARAASESTETDARKTTPFMTRT